MKKNAKKKEMVEGTKMPLDVGGKMADKVGDAGDRVAKKVGKMFGW